MLKHVSLGHAVHRAGFTGVIQTMAHLALGLTQGPAVMEDGVQHQRVGVEGNHQVGEGQAHNKDVSCKDRRRRDVLAFNVFTCSHSRKITQYTEVH